MNRPRPPIARVQPERREAHGHARVDPYAWLENPDDPAVMAYLEAENAYTEHELARLRPIREGLYREFVARLEEDDQSVPVVVDDYAYYSRVERGRDHPIHCRRFRDGAEEVILDVNAWASDAPYFDIADWAVSPDHRYLAWTEDRDGSETFMLRIKDLNSGALLEEVITPVHGDLIWAEDSRTVLYTVDDAARRPWRVFRHRIGESTVADRLVLEEPDGACHLSLGQTKDRRYLLIESASHTSSCTYLLDACDPAAELRLFLPRRTGVEYQVESHEGCFLLLTNLRVDNFELLRTPPEVRPPLAWDGVSDWPALVSGDASVKLEGLDVFRRFLALSVRESGSAKVRVYDFGDRQWHTVEFPEPLSTVDTVDNPDYESNQLRLEYESWLTPYSVYDYDPTRRLATLLKQQRVGSGYDSSRYECRRVWVQAADAVRVPVSLMARRDVLASGPAPTVLYGYGSYGASLDPEFSLTRPSLLERGVVYAVAHVRGGGELGEAWHHAGRLAAKENTFGDFAAAAKGLVEAGITRADALAISGGSAGGLLVGAAINRWPERFCAAVAEVPFVDVLASMMDPGQALTIIEYEEWGNPANLNDYRTMLSYAPLDNVRRGAYPSLLVTTGFQDIRVPYWQAAKWVARLRACQTGEGVLLLKTDMDVGHAGVAGRYPMLREVADVYAFLLDALGCVHAAEDETTRIKVTGQG
ncbi:MAG: S9 family peptidase [Pseudomonadota bacterium]|nr:S9 family peptidase [Pseudomonadota bacterium]